MVLMPPAFHTMSSYRAVPTRPRPQVPLSRRKDVSNGTDLHALVREYNLGDDAFEDTRDRCLVLHRMIKVVIARFALDSDANVVGRWRTLPLRLKTRMIRQLQSTAPWLERFEGDWAAEWILAKCVNQRVVDTQRKGGRRDWTEHAVGQSLNIVGK